MALNDASVAFQYDATPRLIHVVLRQPTREEMMKHKGGFITICTATTEREPSSAAVRDAFEALAAGKEPEGTPPEGHVLLSTHPNFRVMTPRVRLPPPLRSFLDQVRDELHDAATRTVHVLRWRCNVWGGPRPFMAGEAAWSFDGQTWHGVPGELRVVGQEVSGSFEVTEPARGEVEQLVGAGRSEPLGHVLLREAWHQRTSSPRSALAIGVAAAEVGTKECIAELVPDARWLVEEVPTPPLVKMLGEYLPRLPVRLRIGDRVEPPPKAILDTLTKGVRLRNRVVHAGDPAPDYDTVEEVLKAVREVLWLLDYYRGFPWALANLTAETRTALGLDAPPT